MKTDNDRRLKKGLSALAVWSLAVGGIIGWGSFVMPGTTFLKRAGTLGTMIAIETAAFIMLIISYSYSYMISLFPVSGGQYIFARKAFGRTHGFICAWFLSLCYICIIPMNATALCLVFRAVGGGAKIFQFGFHYELAGYDIYFGEVLLAVAALIMFAYISSLGVNVSGKLQIIFIVLLLSGVLINLAALIMSHDTSTQDLLPMFYPGDSSPVTQIISVLVLAPWLFVGFDIVPQLSEESNFSHDKVKSIMDTSILCGCFVYVTLAMIAALGFTSGNYSDWVSYINDLPGLTGINGIATFSAANKVLGRVGVSLMSLSALMAMLTGIVSFYTATSRLLYSMARETLLPSWFMRLNKHDVPMNAILFCMGVSLLAPFVGRNALGWTVDMSSIGGAVSLAYTSLAAFHFAKPEKRFDMIIFGLAGFIFSVMFAFFLVVPVGLDCSLEGPSYVLLVIWIVMGIIFYVNRRGMTRHEG